jgi:LysR family glycine cleavage system transcriptional activator
MLSPKLAASIGGIHEPSDILKLTIIEPTDPWWKRWLEAAGIKDDRHEDRPKLKFSSQILEANAAIAGQGVGILTPIFYRDAVEQGLLMQPFDLTCDTGTAVWLVYPESRRNSTKIQIFQDWMNSEIQDLLSGQTMTL